MKKKNLRQILIPAFIITACIPIAIFTVISQARLKKSTLDNMNNQTEIREWTGFSWYWQIEKESFMTGFLLLR